MQDSQTGRMLNCDEVMQQLWDYLDGELTPERMAAIAAHLSGCERCMPRHDFEREFLQAVRAVRDQHSPTTEQRDRVMAVLRANGLPGGQFQ